jgi:hypothetical protein
VAVGRESSRRSSRAHPSVTSRDTEGPRPSPPAVSSSPTLNETACVRFSRNPSGGSGLSETGSLDRAKAALERRKKAEDVAGNPVLCRVEVTRPNPDSLIDELIKATNLDQSVLESAESEYIVLQ